jgi:hypothetical protein
MNRINFPDHKLSLEAPAGFRRIAVPGFLWCGKNAAGERITVQLWKRNTGLTQLVPSSSALAYSHLHKKTPLKSFLRGPAEGMQVGGAAASFAGIEHKQFGKSVRSYQMLTLFAGNLYLFEYSAPAPLAEKGVKAFTRMLDTVRWAGLVLTPAKPKTTLPAPAGPRGPMPSPIPGKSAPTSQQPQLQPQPQPQPRATQAPGVPGMPRIPRSRAIAPKGGELGL